MPVDKWQLPTSVATRSDLGRLQRELEAVDEFLQQSAIRQPGVQTPLPKTSNLFAAICADNKLNLLQPTDRANLKVFLSAIRDKAPVLHVSFNTDPSPLLIQRLVTWMRQNLHHYVLLQVGLNPTIGAGCVVRTTNKVFDFSLRQRFIDKRGLLMEKLIGNPQQAATQAPPVAQEQTA